MKLSISIVIMLCFPFVSKAQTEIYNLFQEIQNINNILVFIPFGVLFPVKNWKALLLTVLLFSVAIEAAQYALNLGWCEIDDVICNVLGAAIGFGLWKLIKGKMHAV